MKRMALLPVLALVLLCWLLLESAGERLLPGAGSQRLRQLCEEADLAIASVRLPEAEQILLAAEREFPGCAQTQALLAMVYTHLGRTEQARQARRAAQERLDTLRDEGDRRLVLLRLAALDGLHGLATVDSLLVFLNKSHPDHLLVLSARAELAGQRGDTDTAEQVWRRVLQVQPNYAPAYNALGYLAAGRGRYEEAEELLRKHVFLAPDVANAHDSLAEVLSYTGRYEEALAEYGEALRLQPDLWFSLQGLGRIHLSMGRIELGLQVLNRAAEMLGDSDRRQDVERFLIQAYGDIGLDGPYAEALGRYVERWPDEFFFAGRYRALLLLVTGRMDQARDVHDSTMSACRAMPQYESHAVYRNTIDITDLRFAAETAERLGDPEQAVRLWQRESQLNRDRPPHEQSYSRFRYARMLAETDRCEEALEETHFIARVNPRRIQPLLVQARCCLDTGRDAELDKTLAMLEAALTAADEDFPPRRELAALKQQARRRQNR